MTKLETNLIPRRRTISEAENVLPDLIAWHRAGLKTALVTLVGVEGGAPRPLGAQMAVAEDGRYSGYLSGGCLESAVALEAQRAMADGENRIVRYGKGSPYFDIALPCGSGLDLYIDQSLDHALLGLLEDRAAAREAFVLETNLSTGAKQLTGIDEAAVPSVRQGPLFRRPYLPRLRLLLIGAGPSVAAIAELCQTVGLDIVAASPDLATRQQLAEAGLSPLELKGPSLKDLEALDAWSAAVLAFHDHHWEPGLLAAILKRPCFYIGALGSRTVHAARMTKLKGLGLADDEIARVHGPIGIIPGAKSRATLAVSVVAELLQAAQQAGFVA